MIEQIIEILTKNNQTIATMESCTGGALVSAITDIPGASEVLKSSIVTYSNEAKIDFGINPETIDKYTVYSEEVATEMAYYASLQANSTYGIGITGQIGRKDPNNEGGNLNLVHISIYDSVNETYKNFNYSLPKSLSRKEAKEHLINEVILPNILNFIK